MDNNLEIPEKFYIFVNRSNHITESNLSKTKRFFSSAMGAIDAFPEFREEYMNGTATYLPFEVAEPSCKALSMYTFGAINDYRIEYDAEQYRLACCPLYPSRLSAVYAFGDYESCIAVNRKYRWNLNEVRAFTLAAHPLTRIAKLNMEIVSLARHSYKNLDINKDLIHEIWKNYWSGNHDTRIEEYSETECKVLAESGVIWEYLIEGFIDLVEE